ncbi:MAG: hypothetical protein Q4F34_09075 [Prevotellaceae bacterium]|nr:hypothetical protein [Prevotellaceae bacterium]
MRIITKSVFSLCLLFAGIASAFALDDVTINPTFDCNYRPTSDATGWASGTPKMSTLDGNTGPELRWSSNLFSVFEFEVPNFDQAKTLSLKLTRAGSKNSTLGVWYYEYMDELPTDNTVTPADNSFADNVTSAVGTAFGSKEGGNAPLAQASVSDGVYVLAIHEEGVDAIKTSGVTYKADKTTAIIRLVVSTIITQSANTNYVNSNTANDAASRPAMTVSYSATVYPVNNITTGQGYDDLLSAISAADDAEVIEVSTDQNIGSRVNFDNINGKSLTIQAAKDKTVVFKKQNGDNITFLTRGNITVKSGEGKIILDGNNVSTAKNYWEVGNGNLTLDGVTMRNCKNTGTSGIIAVKSNRRLYLNNVTFENNTIADGSCVIYMLNEGASKGAHMTMSGNNTSDVTMIALQAAIMSSPIDVDTTGITNTAPITVNFVSAPTADFILASGCNDATKFAVLNAGLYVKTDGENVVVTTEEPTGIETVDNAQLTIDNAQFNLQGMRVNKDYKGVVIVNGKKYIK